MLFPEVEIARLIALRAEAAKLLGGFSSGIGFIGSPAWALGGAAALGLLQGAISNSMKKQAEVKLQEAAAQFTKVIELGIFFPHATITNIGVPNPHAWHSSQSVDVIVQQKGREVNAGFFGKIVYPPEQTIEQQTTRFTHLEQEFIQVRNSTGAMYLRWTDVTAFLAGIGHDPADQV